MKSKKILSEIHKMKYFFEYQRGVVISEQKIITERDAVMTSAGGGDLKSVASKLPGGSMQKLTNDDNTLLKQSDLSYANNQFPFTNIEAYVYKSPDGYVYKFFKFKPRNYFNDNNFVLINQNGKMRFGTFDISKDLIYLKPEAYGVKEWFRDSNFDEALNFISIKNSGPQQAPNTRQQNINNSFCSVKNGKIDSPKNVSNGVAWTQFISTYKVTTAELATAAKSCPDSELGKKQRKVVFTPNEVFPLKFQQKGENIRYMQAYLGMPANLQTGNFYTRTEAAVKKVFPQYKRETGVTQEMFNQITGLSSTKNVERGELPKTAVPDLKSMTKTVTPNVTEVPTAATTTPAVGPEA